MRSSPATMTEHFTPARFQPLLADVTHDASGHRATRRSARTARRGRRGGSAGAWISSLMTSTSYFAARSASASRVGAVVHEPDRVVRVAEQEDADPVGEGALEALQVERPDAPLLEQRHLVDLTSGLLDELEERRVHGRA